MTDTTHYASDDNQEGVYIPKAAQFERDMDWDGYDITRQDTIIFDKRANTHFVYDDIAALLDTVRGRKDLEKMLETFFTYQVERLDILESYAHGKNSGIRSGDRRIEKNKADYRISHNFGGYISRFATSYMISKPVTITYSGSEDDEGTDDLDDVKEINRINDLDATNYELAFDASVYGRAFEFHYRRKDKTDDLIVRINPQEMFVIRDKTVEKKIIGAVHCPVFDGEIELTIYTDTDIYKFPTVDSTNIKVGNATKVKNPYGRVQVVEWWNNRYREGDFEKEMSIIDAYDSAQSDTANYMSDLNDALLILTGDIPYSIGKLKEMKDANILALETGMTASGGQTTADAKYIYKQYDVQGAEAYKERLLNDMFLLSGIVKISDENFGTQSGVALKYKLFGLQQLKETKTTFFRRALRQRYSIIQDMRAKNGGEKIDANMLEFTFHENLPEDVWTEIKTYIEVGGELSQETLRENSSFTTNKKEVERLEAEDNSRRGLSMEEISFFNAQNGLNSED